ncbi:MAG: cobyrinate a,c-diamide synthase [Spirochaetaceae bacterium]|jgi:cobyrinic acid a,c-diamide synthase|nr:cobyrinate a,c-diamide synthase [Spirochaetaceae bacterium]
MKNLPRIMVSGGGSDSGKTTLTCALLDLFSRRGLKTAAFKCGPDYIDPMFHRETQGTYSSNLDLYMLGEDTVCRLLLENGAGADIAVLEGVMGFYDGVGGGTAEASAWHLSQLTETPVLLVENCKGSSLTAAARIKGIAGFRRNNIRAVLLNNAGEVLFGMVKPEIERETGLYVAGCLPYMPECAIESRHLGLVTAAEIRGLRQKIARLADAVEKTVDIDAILAVAATAPLLKDSSPAKTAPPSKKRPRIAVARDRAFCFYYEDGLRLLEKLGAELVNFSPLNDATLPPSTDGLILGGGYPELYAAELSSNVTMLDSVRDAVKGGLPTLAECGGFMYLHRELEGTDGKRYPLAAVIDAGCEKKSRLVRFGYAEFTANVDNLLCRAGETLRGHEFHYWDSGEAGSGFTAVKPVSGKSWNCIVATETLFAGFPHFHFCAAPETAERFLNKCCER